MLRMGKAEESALPSVKTGGGGEGVRARGAHVNLKPGERALDAERELPEGKINSLIELHNAIKKSTCTSQPTVFAPSFPYGTDELSHGNHDAIRALTEDTGVRRPINDKAKKTSQRQVKSDNGVNQVVLLPSVRQARAMTSKANGLSAQHGHLGHVSLPAFSKRST